MEFCGPTSQNSRFSVPEHVFSFGDLQVCFGGTVVSDIVKIEGILQYRNFLENNTVLSGLRPLGLNFVFQRHNSPARASKQCKNCLQDLEAGGSIKAMELSPQSPDLDSIELLW
ncbi:hypothetical protein Trydic_g17520 [Trypoxylus dichotomus]